MTISTSDSSGLVHVAIPLFLFNQPMGALITGQVFDRYPDPLQLHDVARKLNLSSEALWRCARLEYPMRRKTLLIYARLLETLGTSFLQARYQSFTDAELAAQKAKQIEMNHRILEETRQELRTVTSQLVSAQEEERERMARELHDGIGHGLVLFQFEIHALQQQVGSSKRHSTQAQFEAINDHIRQLADDVRQLSHDLHPAMLQDLGLEAAVRHLGQNVQKNRLLTVEFSALRIPDVIDSTVSLALFRIIQEALQNVVKHAGPSTVSIRLVGSPDSLEVFVRDTGKGFDLNKTKGGLGLINMASRVELVSGSLKVESRPGEGTQIYVRVPWTEAVGSDSFSNKPSSVVSETP